MTKRIPKPINLTRRNLLGAAAAASIVESPACRKQTEQTAPVEGRTSSKAERFSERLLEDVAAGLRAPLSYIGDRLGIFKTMAASGPVTAGELAQKTGLHARYIRAWLEAMTAAEYIDYRPADKKFLLPPEHAAVLADEESPMFMGGALQGLLPAAMITPKVQEAFRTGKGVSYEDYMPGLFESMARWSAPGFKHRLVQEWIPTMPHVVQRLREGASAADVGCGQGLASIVMAKAFPKSRFWGYDHFGPVIERARAGARTAGLADRVTFEVMDGARLPARNFDLITTFDVLHDSANPTAIVRSVRQALAPSGSYFVLEPNLSPRLEENVHAMGRMFYAASLLYCMSVSLGQGGPGIGSDVNKEMVKGWGQAAGFSRIRELPIDGGGYLEMRV
jgi:SAM-dependent methyltransferase